MSVYFDGKAEEIVALVTALQEESNGKVPQLAINGKPIGSAAASKHRKP